MFKHLKTLNVNLKKIALRAQYWVRFFFRAHPRGCNVSSTYDYTIYLWEICMGKHLIFKGVRLRPLAFITKRNSDMHAVGPRCTAAQPAHGHREGLSLNVNAFSPNVKLLLFFSLVF